MALESSTTTLSSLEDHTFGVEEYKTSGKHRDLLSERRLGEKPYGGSRLVLSCEVGISAVTEAPLSVHLFRHLFRDR